VRCLHQLFKRSGQCFGRFEDSTIPDAVSAIDVSEHDALFFVSPPFTLE
jgi:hypothetical protein